MKTEEIRIKNKLWLILMSSTNWRYWGIAFVVGCNPGYRPLDLDVRVGPLHFKIMIEDDTWRGDEE